MTNDVIVYESPQIIMLVDESEQSLQSKSLQKTAFIYISLINGCFPGYY